MRPAACVCFFLGVLSVALAEQPGLRGFRALQNADGDGGATQAPVAPPPAAEVDAALQKQCGAQITACTADDVCRACVANNNPQVSAATFS